MQIYLFFSTGPIDSLWCLGETVTESELQCVCGGGGGCLIMGRLNLLFGRHWLMCLHGGEYDCVVYNPQCSGTLACAQDRAGKRWRDGKIEEGIKHICLERERERVWVGGQSAAEKGSKCMSVCLSPL